MGKYYYTDGTDKYGPFDADELKQHGVTARTLVWCVGMATWQPAETLDELKYLYPQETPIPEPPKFESVASQTTCAQGVPPKTWLVESILVTLFCCMPFGIVGIISASKVETEFYAGRVESAQRASDDARKWFLWGLWTALIGGFLYFITMLSLGILGHFL